MSEHVIGDIVQVKKRNCFGGKNKLPKGLSWKKAYRITGIHRGICGAYDWDDLFLDGFGTQKFCEFDFEKVNQIEDQK